MSQDPGLPAVYCLVNESKHRPGSRECLSTQRGEGAPMGGKKVLARPLTSC